MKIIRSTLCTLKFLSAKKRAELDEFRVEYARIVNLYIKFFWETPLVRSELSNKYLKLFADQTWFSQRLIQNIAREALDMVKSSRRKADKLKEKPKMPVHTGRRMMLTTNIALFENPKNAKGFDKWIHLQSLGNKRKLDIPIRLHKHFHYLSSKGKLCTTIQILDDKVMFSFEIRTEAKLKPTKTIGIDVGIKSLATLSTGEHLGTELQEKIDRVLRCKNKSKGQKRARAALKNYISTIAKEIPNYGNKIVVENLKNLLKKTKKSKRLNKSMRSVIGNWNYALFMRRLQYACEMNRVSIARVSACNTSRTCPVCGYIDKGNRKTQEKFICLKCGHSDNADHNAAINILLRFLTGKYGSGCKAEYITGFVSSPVI